MMQISDSQIIWISMNKDQLELTINYYPENMARFSEQEQVAFQNFFLQTLPCGIDL